jgi:hypothetical protein
MRSALSALLAQSGGSSLILVSSTMDISINIHANLAPAEVKPNFRGFDLNNIDYQWLAGHSAF